MYTKVDWNPFFLQAVYIPLPIRTHQVTNQGGEEAFRYPALLMTRDLQFYIAEICDYRDADEFLKCATGTNKIMKNSVTLRLQFQPFYKDKFMEKISNDL